MQRWLEAHPKIEIISRDRASPYALAARQGAPQAIQVADRWHLLKNLGEALKRMLDTYNKELRLASKEAGSGSVKKEVSVKQIKNTFESKVPMRQGVKDKQLPTKFELNFAEVKRLRKEGHSIKSIHRKTGVHRQTIKRYLKYDAYPVPGTQKNKGKGILKFEKHIREKWNAGENNVKQLWREIRDMGYKGSFQSVYRLTANYPKSHLEKTLPLPERVKIWSAKKVSLLLGKPFESLDEDEQHFLRCFYKHCPAANKASQLARKFKEMTDKLRKKKLAPWIAMAKASGIAAIKSFANGLLQDYDAVKAAVSLKWSNGQVEGQVNRLKNIKRQMYGRASFELLKKRVLYDSY